MPLYEYRCRSCLNISEFLIGVSQNEEDVKCAYCGSGDMDRILSASVVRTGGGQAGPRGGKTCCGRDERCEAPPCSDDGVCKK